MIRLLIILLAFVAYLVYRFLRRRNHLKWAREGFDPAAYGMPPRERLDPTRSGPPTPLEQRERSQAIADAAWAGDWRPAAAYVAEAGDHWDEGWSRLGLLAAVAAEGDSWLTAWRAAEPGDCDAATLEAKLMVHRAWEVRGSGYRDEVGDEAIKSFVELLPAAIEAARRAALLDPANPGPWVVIVTAARGAQFTPEQFQEAWDELVKRAWYHYDGHWQAMQYWCAKWFGSNDKMMAFAERTMDAAPPGSPLGGIYLHALAELEERRSIAGTLAADRTKWRIDNLAAQLRQVRPDDERMPQLRHLLAHFAGEVESYEVALEQFRAIGPWCGAEPWRKQDDPVAAFDLARALAVKRAKAEPLAAELRPEKNADVRHGRP
ncbi:hypothetical protein [Kitasatospora sp. MBT66]|uniref:hypothetical protein n=2 Tax=Kitasatospora TaxID=2063 RepID=UPI00068B3C46|nr:hypothetical protein [Kitasatospora sp. MBT66]